MRPSPPDGSATSRPPPTARPPLEIGLVLAGRADSRTRALAHTAARRLADDLARWFPAYDWRIETSARPDIGELRREESSELLRQAAAIRDTERHDFVILVTPAELVARYRAFALAALSRPLDAAVLSTARLVPDADARAGAVVGRASDTPAGTVTGEGMREGARDGAKVDPGRDATGRGDGATRERAAEATSEAIVVDRLATLMEHAVAHLAGLPSTPDRDRLLHRPESPTDLDAMTRFSPEEIAALDAAFADIADTRLEESEAHAGTRWRFVLRAAAINRGEIAEAVLAARPWEFPQRLSRLTTAAVSTLAILLMTAESWDLGLSQGWPTVLVMALVVLALTSAFVVHRQRLLLTRHRHLREQLVVTRVSALAIVVTGLATTWLGVFALALLAATTLFDATLIAGWAASHELEESAVGLALRVKMATFCASIGLLIGSLGASFEDQHHFRHVIFVDEEL